MDKQSKQPLAIVGGTGTLGRAFQRVCAMREIPHVVLNRADINISDVASVDGVLRAHHPWAVVNCAGYVRVDDAEREPEACMQVNATTPALMAEICARHGIAFLTYSSDLVFDGAKNTPYVESDAVRPLNVYGQSKAVAEEKVLEAWPSAIVVRASAFFGPWDDYNFVTIALRVMQSGERFVAASDGVVSPTYVPDLVNGSLELLFRERKGVWHLANKGALTWADFARVAASGAGYEAEAIERLLETRPTQDLGMAAARPLYSVLGSERGDFMPPLEDALERYFHGRQQFLASN
jgi:dTDP-4-dehydrorhamnose reductase